MRRLRERRQRGFKCHVVEVCDADIHRLIRRGYLDMIGLLPPLEEVDAFVRDDGTARPVPGVFVFRRRPGETGPRVRFESGDLLGLPAGTDLDAIVCRGVLNDLVAFGDGIVHDDGLLNACVFSPDGLWDALRILWRMLRKDFKYLIRPF